MVSGWSPLLSPKFLHCLQGEWGGGDSSNMFFESFKELIGR